MTTPTDDIPIITCSLCCEDKDSSTFPILSCTHQKSCNDCLTFWIEKQEATGQTSSPTCPFCRVVLTPEDVLLILGRPFESCVSKGSVLNEEEFDELTLQFLNEHTKPCPSCGARIEKIEGGCDLMECMCGFRFCYNCGSQGAQCSCTPSNHNFWDNVLDRHAERQAGAIASVDETTGQVDLLSHIQKRKKKEDGKRVRYKRRKFRCSLENERESLDEFVSSGKWLFCPVEKAGLRMLDQYYRGMCSTSFHDDNIHDIRAERRETRLVENYKREEAARLGMVLESFLFLPKAGTKIMDHYLRVVDENSRRKWEKWEIADEVLEHDRLAQTGFSMESILFLPNENAFLRVLSKQESAENTAVLRRSHMCAKSIADADSDDEEDDDEDENASNQLSSLDFRLMNGTILFEKNAIDKLTRLYKQQHSRDEALMIKRWRCPSGLRCLFGSEEAMEEKYNAITVRLFFLLSDEEKEMERAEFEQDGL